MSSSNQSVKKTKLDDLKQQEQELARQLNAIRRNIQAETESHEEKMEAERKARLTAFVADLTKPLPSPPLPPWLKPSLVSLAAHKPKPSPWIMFGKPYAKIEDLFEAVDRIRDKTPEKGTGNGTPDADAVIDGLYRTVLLNHFPTDLVYNSPDMTFFVSAADSAGAEEKLTIYVENHFVEVLIPSVGQMTVGERRGRKVDVNETTIILRAIGSKLSESLTRKESPLATDLVAVARWIARHGIKRPMRSDIGTFANAKELPGMSAFLAGHPVPSFLCNTQAGSSFTWTKPVLTKEECQRVMSCMDSVFSTLSDGTGDCQFVWNRLDLETALQRSLVTVLPSEELGFTTIKVRRVTADGRGIDFHTDVSRRTVSIALNDSSEYNGGHLVYLDDQSCATVIDPRVAGDMLIHTNTISHGVTPLVDGHRYHLFFLTE
jgi:hypothetical protein